MLALNVAFSGLFCLLTDDKNQRVTSVKIQPPPPGFTSINTPLPIERKKNHKNNFLYKNTLS
jgi:hypothetical protein